MYLYTQLKLNEKMLVKMLTPNNDEISQCQEF